MIIHPDMVRNKKELAKFANKGRILCIDPASISCGYCLIVNGKIKESGGIRTRHKDIRQRLIEIYSKFKKKFKKVDLLIMESVCNRQTNKSLWWAVAAILMAIDTDYYTECHVKSWQKYLDKTTYIKSDENDAISIAEAFLKEQGVMEHVSNRIIRTAFRIRKKKRCRVS